MINHLCPAGSAFFQLTNPFPEAFVSRFLVVKAEQTYKYSRVPSYWSIVQVDVNVTSD